MKKKIKVYTLDEIKDEFIGRKGTLVREKYEQELELELLGELIKVSRKKMNLTQEELGKKVGVQKAWISKLEKNAGNVTFETFLKVLAALNAKLIFRLEVGGKRINVAS